MCNIMQIILIIQVLGLNSIQIVANIDKIALNLFLNKCNTVMNKE